jgi:hypothetical protein
MDSDAFIALVKEFMAKANDAATKLTQRTIDDGRLPGVAAVPRHRSALAALGDRVLVSVVVPTTPGRRWAHRSVYECFRGQTWPTEWWTADFDEVPPGTNENFNPSMFDELVAGNLYDMTEEMLDLDHYFQEQKLLSHVWERYYFETDMMAVNLAPYSAYASASEVPGHSARDWNNPCRFLHQHNNGWLFPFYGSSIEKWEPTAADNAPTPAGGGAAPTPAPAESSGGGGETPESSCSTNSDCASGEFCNSADECEACYYPGDLPPSVDACARYVDACGAACDGSGGGNSGGGDSEEDEEDQEDELAAAACTSNSDCSSGEFCNNDPECEACYYPGDLPRSVDACARYEDACGAACDGSGGVGAVVGETTTTVGFEGGGAAKWDPCKKKKTKKRCKKKKNKRGKKKCSWNPRKEKCKLKKKKKKKQ